MWILEYIDKDTGRHGELSISIADAEFRLDAIAVGMQELKLKNINGAITKVTKV